MVSEIQRVTINNVEKNFYSFTTKYCSHHCPLDFPIYDSYVEKVLCYFRNRDKFASFKNQDLKDYASDERNTKAPVYDLGKEVNVHGGYKTYHDASE